MQAFFYCNILSTAKEREREREREREMGGETGRNRERERQMESKRERRKYRQIERLTSMPSDNMSLITCTHNNFILMEV